MTVSYPPALKASDDPATAPNEKAFVAGGGGAPAFDIDTAFGASDAGDFFSPSTDAWTDSGKTSPASSDSDLVYHWDGGRTTGTSLTASQATASARIQRGTDGTYGLVFRNVGGAAKGNSASSASNLYRAYAVRVRLGSTNNAGTSYFSAFDSGPVDGLGIGVDGGVIKFIADFGATTLVGPQVTDTNWHTVVAINDGTDGFLYVDDMTTPVASQIGGVTNGAHTRTVLGHTATFTNDTWIYKWYFNTNASAATPAQLASWLEA